MFTYECLVGLFHKLLHLWLTNHVPHHVLLEVFEVRFGMLYSLVHCHVLVQHAARVLVLRHLFWVLGVGSLPHRIVECMLVHRVVRVHLYEDVLVYLLDVHLGLATHYLPLVR